MSDAALLTRRPGLSLPQAAYTDPAVFAADLEHVWATGWLFAGHTCELAHPGDYVTRDVGRDQVIVVRGEDGALHAHHDVCAHRGSRLTTADRGCVRAFVCPYHQWVYGTDGRLRSARLMGTGFPVGDYRLAPVAVREIEGLVFLCLAPDPPDIEGFAAALAPQLAPHRLADARVEARLSYRVAANWKTLVENNRECYHCRGSHPEFTLSNFDHGVNGDVRSSPRYEAALAEARARWARRGLPGEEVSFPGGAWYRTARLPLRDGFVTESLDGRPVAPFLGTLTAEDAGSLRIVGLPDLWAHANCDYAVTTRLSPVDVGTTDVEVCFLVRADASGVDTDALTAVWRSTSEQDWELCENNYAGIASRGYRPGPLSPVVEASVEGFLTWYTAALDRGRAASA
ncbi:Phenylpropionate dioxygenase large terminal subunit [Pseudonocardia sp. Ae168_Ps1]|uniref:aromatic ring-hydroxylating oxygenase subunit alpha n=1 Tax=unclassified Pseudonocardia TaxID=2619320 RepID=UPI00094B55F9|nr:MULTISPECIES: aromatic ring-hydroxylating dioxygenase subunit alpha [unclassified Pseudonocardia]OLL72311.1 Phenylpropionate dioxygenase large terminal subunit [Pseudonocardia sp. Ae150A_Ps1]OLL78282.1 Phenylpropionate dioxygenase large terminal subunit [Pseudonocardia sp. Ae168_Ps1]OLL87591.1 Phenylpropionate dioxygenase large terminal subunit [Pseudonocardia sp. Ae263_Ps1]OLL92380.1 Phenylpropionate dioxygenase large terminal subunit [Pseudonocardia sp. Ae356_Ps1]